jgi:branched-chain amino acid transport system permease protein
MSASIRRNHLLTALALGLLFLLLLAAHQWADDYFLRLLNTTAIFLIMAVSYNLINGVCGQLHLGPNAFVTLGAYTAALLTLTPAEKHATFLITPLLWPLREISLPFPVALLAGGLVATLFALFTGFPVLRVRGDYLAIVTLGFGEVVRVLANNLQSLTNGPMGLKGLAPYTNLWWSWGVAVLTVGVVTALKFSGYGRAMQAIRADETAARAMGIDPFRHLLLAFLVSAFFLGVAGGLLAHLITTISPTLFTFFLTFNLLIIIVLGGLGSITGAILATIIITWGNEWLRFVEEPIKIGPRYLPGIPGLRAVLFAFLLLVIIIFYRRGLVGRWEFSWNWLMAKGTAWFGERGGGRKAEPSGK